MKIEIATALASGTSEEASASLTAALTAQLAGAPPVLLLAFASTSQPLGELTAALERSFPSALVLGASTAGEFTERGDAKGSVAAFALAGDLRCHAGLSVGLKASPERAVAQALEGLPLEVSGFPHRTGLLLLDPLAGNGEEVTLLAASMLGEGVRLAGGAAGDDLAMRATQVALGGRAESDALVLAMLFSREPLGVGVCHGHKPLSEPLLVTRAQGGVLQEIDGRPAWDVWVEETREAAKRAGYGDPAALPRGQEGAFLLRYEAGLSTGGGDYKIRAPLSRNEDGSLNMACGVPMGAVLQLTESEPAAQVEAAREAARRAAAQLRGPAAGALVFDCICRNLILTDAFGGAIKGISEELGGVPVAGFETYGEIALDVGDMSGFHNTTTVVLAFPRGTQEAP